jgi:hypothetical protein
MEVVVPSPEQLDEIAERLFRLSVARHEIERQFAAGLPALVRKWPGALVSIKLRNVAISTAWVSVHVSYPQSKVPKFPEHSRLAHDLQLAMRLRLRRSVDVEANAAGVTVLCLFDGYSLSGPLNAGGEGAVLGECNRLAKDLLAVARQVLLQLK